MLRIFLFLSCLFVVYSASAQEIDISELDAAARSAKGQSVLFQGNYTDQEAYEQEMRARAEYEREMQARAAYEREMKAREEAMRKAEEERQKALRPVNLFGNSLKIFAEVNGELITSRDMQDRVNAFVVTTQIPVTKQNKEMVLEKVLQSTVDEKIKLQEADKNGIKISESELDKGIADFAKSNGLTVDQLKSILKQAQVDQSVFRSQIKAEMAWGRLVQRKAAQEVRVSRSEIKNAMDTINKDVKNRKFLVSEIVIEKKKADHIEDLVENLRHDPRFGLYAMQFSDSPTAKNGGQLGWVNKGQLPAPLENALLKMKSGDISDPIVVGSDYYILKLEKSYVPGVDKAPTLDEKEVERMIENKKFEEVAEKYLKDLRRQAIINRKA